MTLLSSEPILDGTGGNEPVRPVLSRVEGEDLKYPVRVIKLKVIEHTEYSHLLG